MALIFDYNLVLGLITAGMVGATAGYLGSIMVLRRLALAGDVLSHVALPGIGIALLYNLNPFLMAFVFLFAASWIIWSLEKKTALPTDALIGILFVASLAIGVMLIPNLEELGEALLGDISEIGLFDAFLAILFSSIVFITGSKIYKGLVLGTISEDLAIANGVKLRKINLLFLVLVSIVVALGVKVVGTLLMGALIIVSATAAKNLSRNISRYAFLSTLFGLITAPSGLLLAKIYELNPGPVIILIGVGVFLLTLVFRRS
ncbi:MAG: metal ABC transporter permease [Candidatus Yanofskybacteria bacterium]|nr:metal ABC transporter permease [Candidatus Yanofskybacteria bacterium]